MLTNLEGTRLDAYRLIKRLGGGTFGDVYLAEDLHRDKQDRQIAIKVMEPLRTQAAVQQFLNEVRALVRLQHPHIIPIRDFGVDEKTGVPFIVMEYASKGSLRQCHPKGTPVSLEIIVSYVRQIADALQYAHDDKFVHRDVKPDNVLVGDNDALWLCDFGIVTSSPTFDRNRGQPVQKDAIGSAPYMAPEQIQSHPEKASDQYALAIMVYEWLCGTCPFKGNTPYDVYDQHINIAPRPLRELVASIPAEIEAVVLKGLAKAPRDRYASIREFATALEDAYQQHLKNKKTKEQWFEEGTSHHEAGNYKEAITCFTRAIEFGSNNTNTYVWRSLAYYELKQFDATAYNYRGSAYYELKQFDLAIADLTRAIELDPNFATAYNNRGKVYEDMKQYWQALQDYVQALELDPNHIEASEGKERVKKILKL